MVKDIEELYRKFVIIQVNDIIVQVSDIIKEIAYVKLAK